MIYKILTKLIIVWTLHDLNKLLLLNSIKRIYFKNLNNKEFLMSIECINKRDKDISSISFMIKIQLLKFLFFNNLNDDVMITISDTNYSNYWIFLQWLKHIDYFNQKHQRKAYKLLVMNNYKSYHTRKFLFYCEEHKIISFNLSLHTTHLFQSLNMCIFQSLKH